MKKNNEKQLRAEGDLGIYDYFDGDYPDENDIMYESNILDDEEEIPF